MSSSSRSLLCLLQRCVAVRQVTASAGIKTRGTGLSARFGFIQERAWTSTTRRGCLQRLCQLQSAVRPSQYSFCTKSGAPFDDEYPPLPEYQPNSELDKKEVYIVQVKGLPWSCSAHDLLRFFSDCRIRDGVKGIHLTMDKNGKPSSRAFIEMEHKDDVSKALEKHRQYLGPRYVEVYEVTNRDAEEILKKIPLIPSEDRVVWLRGLPYSCGKDDIISFFSGLDIVEDGITIITDHRGRSKGEAFVEFFSEAAAAEALQRDRDVIGHRYIEVFPRRGYRGSRRAAYSGPQTGQAHKPQTNVPCHLIHMRGLPFEVTGRDIAEFFSPLVVSKILIEFCSDGRPSGEADVYFKCHQDAVAAMSKDRQHLGERYIELFLNSVESEFY